MARPKKPAEEPIRPPWFKFWTSWAESVSLLTNEQAGELLKAMVSFSIDGIEPKFRDSLLKAYWSFMASQMKLDKQKYVNQVESNRRAGKKSAENKSKLNAKKPTQKSGVSVDGNVDGTRDSQQVLTSVNEERRKKEEGKKPLKEPKERIEVTDSLDKAISTNFDVDGYNMANDLWFKYNGRKSLLPQEKAFLRNCVSEHGAEFICGCIGELKRKKKLISTETLTKTIKEMQEKAKEEKAIAEAKAKQRELEKRSREALTKAMAEIKQAFVDVGEDKAGNDFSYFFRNTNDFGAKVMTLLQDDDFAHNGIYHVELAREIIKDLKKNNNPTNIHWLLAELEKRKEQTDEEKS